MSRFERDGDTYSLVLSNDEAEILNNLTEQLLELLGEGDFSHHSDTQDPLAQLLAMPTEIVPPEDSVLKRLLPNAYADPEAASDFRRYTEPQLRGEIQKTLRIMREQLLTIVEARQEEEVISPIDFDLWLVGLNHLRLALAVRVEVDSESFEKFELLLDEDPLKAMYAVYYWLGWLQEQLLQLQL